MPVNTKRLAVSCGAAGVAAYICWFSIYVGMSEVERTARRVAPKFDDIPLQIVGILLGHATAALLFGAIAFASVYLALFLWRLLKRWWKWVTAP